MFIRNKEGCRLLVLAIINQATKEVKSRDRLKKWDAMWWLLWDALAYLDLMNVEYNHWEFQRWVLEGCPRHNKKPGPRSKVIEPSIAGVISGHLSL
jgi:hypothetical protein